MDELLKETFESSTFHQETQLYHNKPVVVEHVKLMQEEDEDVLENLIKSYDKKEPMIVGTEVDPDDFIQQFEENEKVLLEKTIY